MSLELNQLHETNKTIGSKDIVALRQAFFERVLFHTKSPMELIPTLERTFPVCHTLTEALAQLDDLKKCLDSFRPLSPIQAERLQATWDTEYTYESNRIEGNTLSLSETHLVINEGITVAGKTMREHLEAINHKEAIQYLHEIMNSDIDVSEWVIKSMHELILKNDSKYHDQRGKYRLDNVEITGTTFVPPQSFLVPELMVELIEHYHEKKATLHPVELAADIHSELVGIHPFVDGNGRTSRLIMNLILLRAGFPIANISGDRSKRLDYYHALNDSHLEHQDEPFRMLVAHYVRDSLFRYLAMVSGNMNPDAEGKGGYFYERMALSK
jgi:Fic family protein